MLRVCERFGWTMEYVRSITPEYVSVLVAYDELRTVQEARARIQ